MTSVMSPLLNAHITRFSGSRGSGTDLGRTTVSVVSGFGEPTAGLCPWANGARHNARTTSAEPRILQPGAGFNGSPFFVWRRKSFGSGRRTRTARRVLVDHPVLNGCGRLSGPSRCDDARFELLWLLLPAYRFGSRL